MWQRLCPWLASLLVGLVIGAVWEGIGKSYLWTLSPPVERTYALALLAWMGLGVGCGAVLRLIDRRLPAWKRLLKPLAGPSALCAAALTRELGLITYPATDLSVQGIPLYMMIGWLTLVYVMDRLGWYRSPSSSSRAVRAAARPHGVD